MRDTPQGIVEELRYAAEADARDIGVAVEDLLASSAADYIEHLSAALQRVADGESEPEAIARDALDPVKWMLGG